MSSLRIVFFGTPAFATPTLAALLGSSHRVVGVVTQPDRPRGRGQRLVAGPVKATAVEAQVPTFQPETLKGEAFPQILTDLGADLGVVAAYGRILSERVLQIPKLGMVNVHASLLPRHRGAAPIHRAVMAGDGDTGVTIMRVVKALDAGPMLAVRARPIGPDETSEDVERGLAIIGAELLLDTVNRMAEGSIREEPQDEGLATYASRLTREDGVIDWRRSARDLHNQVRGLYPWPHAFTYLDGRRFILLRTAAVGADGVAVAPGTIVPAAPHQLRVATGDGLLDLLELQAEGGRPLGVREFLAGHHLTPGSRFVAPS